MSGRLNLLLALLLAAVLAAHWLLGGQPTARNLEFIPEMVDAVPFESYSASATFADGKTMQVPPAHVVLRGAPTVGFGNSREEAARAGRELVNPFDAADPGAAARGAWVFATYCAVCHGNRGEGDGPVAQRGFPAPPSLLLERARRMADGQVFHLLTFGQNNMPPYAAQIPAEDRWKAVLHVRRLQAAVATPESPAPPREAAASSAPTGPPVAPAALTPALPLVTPATPLPPVTPLTAAPRADAGLSSTRALPTEAAAPRRS